MDANTIAMLIGFLTIAASIIAVGFILSRQSGKQDADIAALRAETKADIAALDVKVDNLRAETNARFDNLSAELRNEIRELGYRIENRIALDERVREVEQRTAPAPQAQRRDAETRRDSQS